MKRLYNKFNKKGYYHSYTPSSGKELVIIILCLLVVILMLFACGTAIEDKEWNDGHCPVCGSEWRYVEAVGHRYTTSYIYVCDKCNTHIEVSNEPNWAEVGITTTTTEETTETTKENQENG